MISYLMDLAKPPHKRKEYNPEELSHESCLGCRLFSGGGIAAAGCYVYYQTTLKPTHRVQKFYMLTLAYGLIGIGALRIFDLPPFGRMPNDKQNQTTSIEKSN